MRIEREMKNQFSRASEKIRSHFFSRFFEIETLVNAWPQVQYIQNLSDPHNGGLILRNRRLAQTRHCTLYHTVERIISNNVHCKLTNCFLQSLSEHLFIAVEICVAQTFQRYPVKNGVCSSFTANDCLYLLNRFSSWHHL